MKTTRWLCACACCALCCSLGDSSESWPSLASEARSLSTSCSCSCRCSTLISGVSAASWSWSSSRDFSSLTPICTCCTKGDGKELPVIDASLGVKGRRVLSFSCITRGLWKGPTCGESGDEKQYFKLKPLRTVGSIDNSKLLPSSSISQMYWLGWRSSLHGGRSRKVQTSSCI